jgi:hypothetical protein
MEIQQRQKCTREDQQQSLSDERYACLTADEHQRHMVLAAHAIDQLVQLRNFIESRQVSDAVHENEAV